MREGVHMRQNTREVTIRIIFGVVQSNRTKERTSEGHHDRLYRTVINPGTDLTFSRATGLWGSGRDEREAEAE
jgi:hypothetical protein